MKLTVIRFFLTRVLAWIADLPWADFIRIVRSAAFAEDKFTKTPDMSPAEIAEVHASRRQHVADFIARTFALLRAGWKRNVILELAVAWLNRTTPNA